MDPDQIQPVSRKVAILADFIAAEMREYLALYFEQTGLAVELKFGSSGKALPEFLAVSHSPCDADLTVLLLRPSTWQSAALADPDQGTRKSLTLFEELVQIFLEQPHRPELLIINCVEQQPTAISEQVDLLLESLELGRCHLTIWSSVDPRLQCSLTRIGHQVEAHPFRDETPYTLTYYSLLSNLVARLCYRLWTSSRKAIVVDCDNTLWHGVCGELGATGVTITAEHRSFQQKLIERYEAGMAICLASKNNLEDVNNVFAQNEGMLLRWEHLTAKAVNWGPKHLSLLGMSEELGFSLETFLFIDDDPYECDAMRAVLPEVQTLQFPASARHIPEFIYDTWDFDKGPTTMEDRCRAVSRRAEDSRRELRESGTFESFVEKLQLNVTFSSLTEQQCFRAAQLTARVTQFNLTGHRLTECDLLTTSQEKRCITVSASDRFGDYGIVGLLIFGRSEETVLLEEAFLSCRVLGRGIEPQIAGQIRSAGADSGTTVHCLFKATKRNAPIKRFLHVNGLI